MKRNHVLVYQLLVSLLPLVFLAIVWKRLPQSIPMHYGEDSVPDRMGNKSEMLGFHIFMATMGFAVGAFVLFADRFDKKYQNTDSSKVLLQLSWAVVAFLAIMSIYDIFISLPMIVPSTDHGNPLMKGIEIIVCLFFAMIGRIMLNTKSNMQPFVRLPWLNIKDENFQKMSHKIGKMWFWGSILLAIIVLIVPLKSSLLIFTSGIIAISVLPMIYSLFFLNNKKS